MRKEKIPDEEFDAIIEKEMPTLNRHERRLLKFKREAMRSVMASGQGSSYILTSGGEPAYKSPNNKPGNNGGTK
jgi:hypothetical protein